MTCKCQKPCGKDICCNKCHEVENCKYRCGKCVSKKQVKKEESNPKEE